MNNGRKYYSSMRHYRENSQSPQTYILEKLKFLQQIVQYAYEYLLPFKDDTY